MLISTYQWNFIEFPRLEKPSKIIEFFSDNQLLQLRYNLI